MSNETTQKAWQNWDQGESNYENGRFLGQISTVASNQTYQSISNGLNLPSSTNSLFTEDFDDTRDCTVYQDLLMKDGKFTIVTTPDQIPTKFRAGFHNVLAGLAPGPRHPRHQQPLHRQLRQQLHCLRQEEQRCRRPSILILGIQTSWQENRIVIFSDFFPSAVFYTQLWQKCHLYIYWHLSFRVFIQI